jgi:hypothetical protein
MRKAKRSRFGCSLIEKELPAGRLHSETRSKSFGSHAEETLDRAIERHG